MRPIAIRFAAILLFCACLAVYHSNLRLIAAGDSLPSALVPLSVLLDHSTTLDRFAPWLWEHAPYTKGIIVYRNGHYHSFYPLGQSLLITPFYIPAVFSLHLERWDTPSLIAFARVYEKFVSAAIAALSAALMLLLLERITTRGWALALAALYAFGTSTWSTSSQALWQHTGGELLIVSTLFVLQKWRETPEKRGLLWWAGLFAGLALMVRITNAVLALSIAMAMIAVRIPWGSVLRFLALPVGSGLLLASDNLLMFSSPLGGYGIYASAQAPHQLIAAAGLLVSPGRGLFLFSPFLIFALFSLASGYRSKARFLTVCCGSFVLAYWILMARWPSWWGGWSWGPRLLTETVPALVVLLGIGAERLSASRWKIARFTAAACFSIFVQAVGAHCYPNGAWDAVPQSVDENPSRLWDWKDSPIRRTAQAGLAKRTYVDLLRHRDLELAIRETGGQLY
jgi:hypothetical protein